MDVYVGIRPEHLEIDPKGDTHTVDLTEALGGVSYAHLLSASGSKTIVEERGDERSKEGAKVGVKVAAGKTMLFDRQTEVRIR